MIRLEALSKRYGARVALEAISTEIAPGALALLLGANGAGKTTLLRCLLGLLTFEGRAWIGGRDVVRDGRAARVLVGYVPQRPALPEHLACGEVLDLFARLRGLRRPDLTWLERLGLGGRANAPVRTLSGGLRQRLMLAVALQADPPVLLFDEPAANLDVAARRALHRDLDALAREGRTVVLATHLAADPLQTATQALVLHEGRLVYDGPAERLRAAALQRVVFGMNGAGREDLRALLGGRPGVRLAETPAAVVVTAPAGQAFDLLAAVAAAGIRPLEVHVEEPAIDPEHLAPAGEARR